MTRPVEPNWPTADDIEAEVARRADTHLEWSYSGVAIEMCRAAWLAANDDPSTDLPGTVRIQPETGVRWIKLGRIGGRGADYWRDITGAEATRRNDEVVGWTRGTPVEGTPAARAGKCNARWGSTWCVRDTGHKERWHDNGSAAWPVDDDDQAPVATHRSGTDGCVNCGGDIYATVNGWRHAAGFGGETRCAAKAAER